MKVKSIAECPKGSILQYFWPALIGLENQLWSFLSGRFTQVLLYIHDFLAPLWNPIADHMNKYELHHLSYKYLAV